MRNVLLALTVFLLSVFPIYNTRPSQKCVGFSNKPGVILYVKWPTLKVGYGIYDSWMTSMRVFKKGQQVKITGMVCNGVMYVNYIY